MNFLIGLCVLVAIIFLFYKPFIAILGIVVLFFICAFVCKLNDDKKINSAVEARMLSKRTNIYKNTYEHSGFSISSRGYGRSYWKAKKQKVGTNVSFEITDSSGKTSIVTVLEDSEEYNILVSKQKKSSLHSSYKSQKEVFPPYIMPRSNALVETQSSLKPPAAKPKILNIPFEILPNEYSLEIKHESCIFERTDGGCGRYEVNLFFELHYNPNIRGITNRHVVASLYNKDGKIVAVQNTWPKTLDKSGCKIIEIKFWKDIEEEPTKVSISLERSY